MGEQTRTSIPPTVTTTVVIDLARTAGVLVEINQLDTFWRSQIDGIAPEQQPSAMAALRPILDRMGELLNEFQAITLRIGGAGKGHAGAVRTNLANFISENRTIGLGAGNDGQLLDTKVRDDLLTLLSDRTEVDFDAAAAKAAAALAAAAEAERIRLEAEAAALAAGTFSGGGGGGAVVDGIAGGAPSAIIKSGLSSGGMGGAGGGHPLIVLGCMLGATIGEPKLGCLAGYLVDHVMKTQEGNED